MDPISALHKLEVIDISHNALISIPVQLNHLIGVKRLRLNNNHLRQLPPTIKHMVNLQELNVNSNLLASFPFELGALRLQHFRYFDNERLTSPPKEIQAQGPEVSRMLLTPPTRTPLQPRAWPPQAVLAYMRARIERVRNNPDKETQVLYFELWGKEGEIGSHEIGKDTTLKQVREYIMLMVDEAKHHDTLDRLHLPHPFILMFFTDPDANGRRPTNFASCTTTVQWRRPLKSGSSRCNTGPWCN